MKWFSYGKDHAVHFLLLFLLFVLTEGILLLFHATHEMQIFILSVMFFMMTVMILYDYFRCRTFYQELEERMQQLEKKYLIMEMMERPSFLEGKLLYDNLSEIAKSMNDEMERHARINEEWKQYMNTWVHEIKIPISAMKLIVHNNKDAFSRKLQAQLKRIDMYVEQVLYYIRSEVPQEDYVIQNCPVRDMIDTTVRENKDSLILEHFRVENAADDVSVLTDKKWLSFMLGQIISNAVKYAADTDRSLKFYTGIFPEAVKLVIEDHGIGIKKSDLPRIFDKSFTGKNGRSTRSSTGMGLYLCKKLCRELGHKIEAESVEGSYTRIIITMSYKK